MALNTLPRAVWFLGFALALWGCTAPKPKPVSPLASKPQISFTFDDGITDDLPGFTFKEWNALLLGHLKKEGVQAAFYVTGRNKLDEKGRFLLQSWDEAGHSIGNHTFTHPNYNSEKTTFEVFKTEFLRTDSVINGYKNYVRQFRFPYLKEGNTPEKIAAFRQLMATHGYRNGYVTIDASDWAIDARLRKKLRAEPNASLEPYRKFYLEHLLDRANFYESLAVDLTGRHVRHTLLLHHNLTSALFVGDLVQMFRQNGWEVVSASAAFADPIFRESPTNVPAGESLIWALAKQSGRYESRLRYPAEDETYERAKMDLLGL